MVVNSQKKSPEQLNREYFESLIGTRASIASLNISLAGLAISLVCLPITWDAAISNYKIKPLQSIVNILIICVAIFMLVTFLTIICRFSRKFLFQHQGFASIWLTIFSIVLTFILMFLFYMITQFDEPKGIWYGSKSSIVVIFIFGAAYIFSFIYNIYWLKRQLKNGFSEDRTTANYLAKASVYNSKSLWVIFGFSISGGLLTGNLMRIFGVVFGIIIAAAFSRLTIECIFASYLLNTNKEYWINFIDEPEISFKERMKKRLKKPTTYAILSVILIAAITVIETRYKVSEIVHIVFSYLFLASFIYLGVAFIMWIVKKVRNKNS